MGREVDQTAFYGMQGRRGMTVSKAVINSDIVVSKFVKSETRTGEPQARALGELVAACARSAYLRGIPLDVFLGIIRATYESGKKNGI